MGHMPQEPTWGGEHKFQNGNWETFSCGSKIDTETWKFRKKSDIFLQKIWGKYFDLFSKIFSKDF